MPGKPATTNAAALTPIRVLLRVLMMKSFI
jgi:hypothetical protein